MYLKDRKSSLNYAKLGENHKDIRILWKKNKHRITYQFLKPPNKAESFLIMF